MAITQKSRKTQKSQNFSLGPFPEGGTQGTWGRMTDTRGLFLPRAGQQLSYLQRTQNLIFDTLEQTQFFILIALERANEKNVI